MAEHIDIEKIRQLADLMRKRGLTRVFLTEDGVTVRLETATPPVTVAAGEYTAPQPVMHYVAPEAKPPVEEPAAPEGVPLTSPTTGTFYRAPAPGEAPFVDVGDIVEPGQTVGIIMAMKVMSEVPAEIAGEVVAIPAEDGQLVQAGDTLIVVRPQ